MCSDWSSYSTVLNQFDNVIERSSAINSILRKVILKKDSKGQKFLANKKLRT